MNEQEYIAKFKKLESDFKDLKLSLKEEYLTKNAKFKVGDIVSDGDISIEITHIVDEYIVDEYSYSYHQHGAPIVGYRGYLLTKTGKRRKDEEIRFLRQDSLLLACPKCHEAYCGDGVSLCVDCSDEKD